MPPFRKELKIVKQVGTQAGQPLRLLQISDLHFKSTTKIGVPSGNPDDFLRHLESQLRQLYPETAPCDLVAVTGDLIDYDVRGTQAHREALDKAANYLHHLCADVLRLSNWKDRLLVIPGNHDCRFNGILRRWRSGQAVEESQFYEVFGNYAHHRFYESASLLIACFDSNVVKDSLELAMGNVSIGEFADLDVEIAHKPLDVQAAIQRATRVALVHHHPLPIGENDDFERRHLIERLTGRRLEGAPEFMLLRNAGTFLNRLLGGNYRLVLHGHLHCGGYWRPLTYTSGRERWLEVIACGGTGAADRQGNYYFNCLEFFGDGFIRATQHGFNREGGILEPRAWSTASYETVRAYLPVRPSAVGKPLPLRCKTHTVMVDVFFPFGDLVTREIIEDLQWEGDKEISSLPLLMSASHVLSSPHIDVLSLHPKYTVRVNHKPEPLEAGPEGPRTVYRIVVTPPLRKGHQPLSLVCQRSWLGALFSSQEDKRKHEVEAGSHEWDIYSRVVRWPCEHLMLHLRFWPHQWEPLRLRTLIRDSANMESIQEEASLHVADARWQHRFATPRQISVLPGAEACLSIYRPRVGYSYALQWDLKETGELSVPPNVSNLRRQLRDLSDPQLHKHMKTLLKDAVLTTWSMMWEGMRQPGGMDETILGYWFSYDERDGTLRCQESTARHRDFLLGYPIRWGQDIIGTACRRREGMTFSRKAYALTPTLWPLSPEFQQNIGVLLAFPIMPEYNWVLGILAVATPDQDSRLRILAEDNDLAQRWSNAVDEVWTKYLRTT